MLSTWIWDSIMLNISNIPVKAGFTARKNALHPNFYQHLEAPGGLQRKKGVPTLIASKYFPYGHGSAIGISLWLKDMGESYEDEEEFGEYQKDRIDEESGQTAIWD